MIDKDYLVKSFSKKTRIAATPFIKISMLLQRQEFFVHFVSYLNTTFASYLSWTLAIWGWRAHRQAWIQKAGSVAM
jgi:hypothetical protein